MREVRGRGVLLLRLLAQGAQAVRDFSPLLVSVDQDVVPLGVGREETDYGVHGQGPLGRPLFQHRLCLVEQLPGLLAHSLIVEDLGVTAVWVAPAQLPGLEEGVPVDRFEDLLHGEVPEHARAEEAGAHGLIGRQRPVHLQGLLPRLLQAQVPAVLEAGVELVAHLSVRLPRVFGVLLALHGVHHGLADRHRARGIQNVDGCAAVLRRDLDRRVHLGSRGPPMSSGVLMPRSSIRLTTVTISSREGVMSPLRPMMSALCSSAASRIFSQGHITPRSITLKLLQPRTTATIFFPMSCTSPLTVAMMTVPAWLTWSVLSSPDASASASFSASMKGMRWATAFFITRADLMTCGRNILPEPNRSPTTFIPSMSGPSMMCRGRGYSPDVRHTSTSGTMNVSMPRIRACSMRFGTGASRQSQFCAAFSPPPPAPSPFRRTSVGLHLGSSVPANSSMRSVALEQRFSRTSSTYSNSSGSILS